MKLSIIIVNYNVKHFLKQCIHSVAEAASSISHEIICIDNHSVDGSVEMLSLDFPEVHLIQNKKNIGFAKACNQGIKWAKGKYLLFLNPDTVLENDSLNKPIEYMDTHPEAGSLGVKMLDGNGKYLPESKRGLPTPAAAFYKMSGLSKIFYPSKTFGKYYLDHLDKDKIQSIHVLSGAFMLIRKSVLDKVGPFDEQFFMYGEDVDLSHRIIKAGFKNIYYPATRIIHYKGESTKKESIKYVYSFYNAMLIFSKKHFSKKNSSILSLLLKSAIVLKALLALLLQFVKQIFFPLIDATIIAGGLFIITKVWESTMTYPEGGSYPLIFYQIVIPIFILIWLGVVFLAGGYDKPYRPKKIIIGIFSATVIILISYALLDESYRFSRSITLMGSTWALIALVGLRWLYQLIGINKFSKQQIRKAIIVAKPDEADRIKNLLIENNENIKITGYISPVDETIGQKNYLGTISSIPELVNFYKINELIFCSRDISFRQIIDNLSKLKNNSIKCKIAPKNSYSIIGSKSISNTEDLFLQEISTFSNPTNIRIKRMLDLVLAIIFIMTFPIILFIVKKPAGLLRNIFQVILNKKSWVGFIPQTGTNFSLSNNKSGILDIADGIKNFKNLPEIVEGINLNYAQKYYLLKDIQIIYMGFKELGRG